MYNIRKLYLHTYNTTEISFANPKLNYPISSPM